MGCGLVRWRSDFDVTPSLQPDRLPALVEEITLQVMHLWDWRALVDVPLRVPFGPTAQHEPM